MVTIETVVFHPRTINCLSLFSLSLPQGGCYAHKISYLSCLECILLQNNEILRVIITYKCKFYDS